MLSKTTIGLLLLLCLVTACSGDPATDKQEKNGNSFTKKVAQQGLNSIQSPLNKAQQAALSLEKHALELKKQEEESMNR